MYYKNKNLEELLTTNSKAQTNKLRHRLLRDGIFVHSCANCFNTVWQNKPIPLELSHINGNNSDNRLQNLELLCPNCHAQTDSYRGKNKGKAINRHHYANVAQSAEA